jgi:antitoxin ParD1/3/4
MATETLNFSLPDGLKRYVERRVDEGGYGNTSEYLRELIRQDKDTQRRQAQARLEALLLEGIQSGPAEPLADDEWEGIRREGLERLAAKRSRPNTRP